MYCTKRLNEFRVRFPEVCLALKYYDINLHREKLKVTLVSVLVWYVHKMTLFKW